MRIAICQSMPPSMIARTRAVRWGVASEVAQASSNSASRLNTGPDLSAGAI